MDTFSASQSPRTIRRRHDDARRGQRVCAEVTEAAQLRQQPGDVAATAKPVAVTGGAVAKTKSIRVVGRGGVDRVLAGLALG
jgi:hypothetical protein